MKRKETAEESATAADVVAAIVRGRSKSGRLISGLEIGRRLGEERRVPLTDPDADIRSTLAQTLRQHGDLRELPSEDGARYYYSSHDMTEGYASMLLQRGRDPARLIAEVVRRNSASYPRPVPLDLFTRSPFDLTAEEVLDCLERMGGREEYRDIASSTTSASTIFLYSTLHLEPEHASMLAEWLDVGQGENP